MYQEGTGVPEGGGSGGDNYYQGGEYYYNIGTTNDGAYGQLQSFLTLQGNI